MLSCQKACSILNNQTEWPIMKTIVIAAVASILLGITAAFVLSSVQRPAYEVFATQGARVSDPGGNLVGGHWTGNPANDPPLKGQHSRREART